MPITNRANNGMFIQVQKDIFYYEIISHSGPPQGIAPTCALSFVVVGLAPASTIYDRIYQCVTASLRHYRGNDADDAGR